MIPRILCIIEDLGLGGGAEQLLLSMVPKFRGLGIDVEIATLFKHAPNHAAALRALGVVVHELDMVRNWNIARCHLRLRKLCKARKPDLVWGHLFFGNLHAVLLVAMRGAGRSIVTLHSEGYMQNPPNRRRDKLFCAIEHWTIGWSKTKVAVSQAVARDYEAFFGWRAIKVIHNGVDCSEIPAAPSLEARRTLRATHGVGDDKILAIVPSRFIPKKGHAYLIEALALLKCDAEPGLQVFACNFATPLQEKLKALAMLHGVAHAITFVDAMPHAKLFPLMQAADMVIIPSLREPFGIAGAESMALGAPTILTKVDGFMELVGDSDGALLVPPHDPTALANAIRHLRDDRGFAAEQAARGKARVEANFSIVACSEKWANLFHSLLVESL